MSHCQDCHGDHYDKATGTYIACPGCGHEDLEARLRHAFQHIDNLEAKLAEAQTQILYEQERNRNNVGLACEERDALKATVERAREALRDSTDLMMSLNDSVGGQIIDNEAVLAALDAGNGETFELRYRDLKFGISTSGQIVKRSNGDLIPEDEPIFILRARDYLAVPLLLEYRRLCVEDGCTQYHLDLLDRGIEENFRRFAREHPDRMKQPGITKGV